MTLLVQKSHLQLVSDLGFELKDSKSEVKAFHLVPLQLSAQTFSGLRAAAGDPGYAGGGGQNHRQSTGLGRPV